MRSSLWSSMVFVCDVSHSHDVHNSEYQKRGRRSRGGRESDSLNQFTATGRRIVIDRKQPAVCSVTRLRAAPAADPQGFTPVCIDAGPMQTDSTAEKLAAYNFR